MLGKLVSRAESCSYLNYGFLRNNNSLEKVILLLEGYALKKSEGQCFRVRNAMLKYSDHYFLGGAEAF